MSESNRTITKQKLVRKILQSFRLVGREAVYHALLLFHTLRAPDTPPWCKSVALGALAYFISMIDGIPDLTPVLGYTDDVALMAATLATISTHVTPEIKDKAQQDADRLFPENR